MTTLKAEINVTFFVEDKISIESEVRKLDAVFETGNVFKTTDFVVGQEHPLQVGTVVKAVDLVNDVAAEI